jgi:hypothetical protein
MKEKAKGRFIQQMVCTMIPDSGHQTPLTPAPPCSSIFLSVTGREYTGFRNLFGDNRGAGVSERGRVYPDEWQQESYSESDLYDNKFEAR